MTKQWDTTAHYEEFKSQGFTVMKGMYSKEVLSGIAEKFYELREEEAALVDNGKLCLISNMIERRPKLFLPIMANPAVIDLIELIIGPFVQISDSVIFCMDPISHEEAQGKVNGWHRDRYSEVPSDGVYHRPRGMNALCYLQDLTDEYGPLRVIPGSHMRAMTLEDSEKGVPHAEEVLIHIQAGDVVVFHNALLHSGSPNTSGKPRIHMGGSYIPTWMKPFDNHNGPNVQKLIKQARARNDHRMLRLFGVDDHMEKRMNSNFLKQDEVVWKEWAARDREVLKEG